MSYTIIGTGSALPQRIVSNDELSTFLDTSDEWIRTRTGIVTRHVAATETLDELAEAACKRALESAGVTIDTIDLIVCSTTSADHLMPAEACAIAERLGVHGPAFDVSAACSGFVYALDVADGYFARGRAKRALIVSAEKMTRIMDWTDRSTCVLFGDGAGAVVAQAQGESPLWTRLTCDPNVAALEVPGVAGNCPFDQGRVDARLSVLSMKGPSVFHFAVSHVARELQCMEQETGISLGQIDHFIFHQANERILDAIAKKLSIPNEKIAHTIAETGNISSACIPYALDQLNRAGKLKAGELIVLVGFGAGLDIGSTLIRWKTS